MTERLLSSDPNDIRFGYEVIKSLSDSVRQTVAAVGELRSEISEDRKAQSSVNLQILERLVRIESNRVNEEVADLRARHDALNGRVDNLESERDERIGGGKMRRAVITWWPVIAMAFTVLWLLFRATGVITLPKDTPTVILAPPVAEGGK